MRISPAARRGLTLLILLLVVGFAAFLWYRPLLNIGAGYAAKHACSCHFLQQRSLAAIRSEDLNFSVLGSVSLERAENEVRAAFFGLTPRRAVYRPGVGCTIVNDERQPLAELQGGGDAGAGPVSPGEGKGEVAPEEIVRGSEALSCALDYGMRPVAGGGARGLVVLREGRLAGERYAEGYGPATPLLGWSMTKTLTGLVVGYHLANPVDKDLASPPDFERLTARRGLFPSVWTDSARQQITVGHLLRMHSGLAWNETYGALSDATVMLHEHADMAAYAVGAPAVAPAGEEWVYSSGTTNILAGLVEAERGPGGFADLCRRLLGPVAPSLVIEPSQAGLPVGSSYGWATARDWARLGQFMLRGGVWRGDTLLPPGWVDWMRRPAAGSEGTYGGQLWLPAEDVPSLPRGAYLMRGFQDQRVFVLPEQELVIARLGHNDDKTADFDGLVSRVLAAFDDPEGACE